MKILEKAGPVLAGLVIFLGGASFGHVIVPSGMDAARRHAIENAVTGKGSSLPEAVASGDPLQWRALRELDMAWPGHIDWLIRHGDEARTLFAANGQKACPQGEILHGVARCVFNAPKRPTTIGKREELAPALGANH